jgi:putrescine transport system substrate-binding protein
MATACGRRERTGDEPVVNLYNWYDYLSSQVLRDFQSSTGILPRYDAFDSNQTLEAKLLAGHSGYDVVFPSAATLQRLSHAALFQPLDRARLPHYANLDARFLAHLAPYDAGNLLSVPYTWGITGIGIDVARVRERLAAAPPDSWALLFDPQVLARLETCGVGLYESPTTIVPSTLAWLGLPPTGSDPSQLERAGAALLAARRYIRKVTQGSLVEDLANGELCVIIASDGDVRQAQERARTAGRKVDLQFIRPREGATLWFDVAAIPVDAPHVAQAYRFIDFLLEAAPAAANSTTIGFATANAAAQSLLPPSLTNAVLYPPDEAAQRLFAETDHDEVYVRRRTRLWTHFRTGI